MTDEELDGARAEEAWRIFSDAVAAGQDLTGLVGVALIAARLARTGWTPPEPVDPDELEARKVWELHGHKSGIGLALAAIKRGREMERAGR